MPEESCHRFRSGHCGVLFVAFGSAHSTAHSRLAPWMPLLVLGLVAGSAPRLDAQSVPLNQRVLVVYNANVADSVTVANYYATKRQIPSGNLCAISPPQTAVLAWSQFVSSVKTPIQNCLNAVGPDNILYIVFTYQTPFRVVGSTSYLAYALDQYVADIWDQYANQDAYPFPAQPHPYFDDVQSQGNVYQPFLSLSDYRAQSSALRIYSVWRLDGASAALAEGLVDKALAAESSGLTGSACLDRRQGPISQVFDAGYGEGEWGLHQAATFAEQTGFPVIEDSNYVEFGTPPAPLCPNAALYSGWYRLNHYNDAFTWNTGAIGFHLDSNSAADPRGGPNWSANAIQKGITVTSGSVTEPYLEGLARPDGIFRDLFQGANVGDAFLRNTRWLKWKILYLGDPLYRPFPEGLPPFNPPAASPYLFLSSRYVVNGASSTATVALASPAPAGGTIVNLTSSNSALVPVPSSITVPEGGTTASVVIQTASSPQVLKGTPVLISASNGSHNTLTVSPLLGGLFITPPSIIGGAPATGMVFLNANAPTGGTVVALSNNGATSVPATITVPAGRS